MDKLVYWIWLSLCCTPDSLSFKKLNERYKGAEEIFGAEDYELRSILGSRSSDCTRLREKKLDRAIQILDFCKKKNVGIVTFADEDYPSPLREISSPPPVLYYRGRLPHFKRAFFASVVGARKLSAGGRINAFRIGHDLAAAGATVVSGMAIGVDGVALAGAISGGGYTVAVIGSGIDVCYPPEHRRLAQEIVKNGCVITEFAPGTKPSRFNFPKRNRVISALSAVTVVVEGTERSGALTTARYAKEQGRKVYAFPGNVSEPNSQLPNLLIKNGATLCTGADDIVRDFEKEYSGILNPFAMANAPMPNMNTVLSDLKVSAVAPSDRIFAPSGNKKQRITMTELNDNSQAQKELPENFNKEALKIYKKIPIGEAVALEALVDADTPLRAVMKSLLKLEMGRFVEMLPGDRVKRI